MRFVTFPAAAALTLISVAACKSGIESLAPLENTISADLMLPPGFESTVVFEGTGESRELLIRSDGDIFVSLSGIETGPHILGLRDDNGDFIIDTVKRFHNLKTPSDQRVAQVHIEYFNNFLYAVDNTQIIRMHLPPGRLSPVGGTEVVVSDIPYQRSHRGRTLSIDTSGWVYVNIGAPSNACQQNPRTPGSPGIEPCPQLDAHAGIWRWRGDVLNQSREDGEKYAGGIRNAIAQTWDAAYDGLYVGQMGRDRLDSLWPDLFDSETNAELPAEEFFRVERGQDYGWPYCYYDHVQQQKVLAPEYGGDGRIVGRCNGFAGPQVTFPGHYSPSSIAFYHARQFPASYHGGAFVALKGSWNRAPMPQDGYIVAFVPFADGAPTGQWQTFADGFKGFETLFERGNAVYRPQSVAVHPDGSLYVLDNNKGRIWRITYTGVSAISTRGQPQPDNDRSLIVATSQGPGNELYLRYCAACHQAEGGGIPGEVPPLTDTAWVSGDKGRLIRSVVHGMQGRIEINDAVYDDIMPGHGFLNDEQLAALLTFVRSSFGRNPDPVHQSEIILVRNSDKRTTLWIASELWQQRGLTGAQ